MISSAQLNNGWWLYALVAAAYTAAVRFLSTDSIFSKGNARPISYVIRAHLVFLVIILGLTWLEIRVYLFMPDWVTNTSGRASWFGFLCVGIGIVLALVESRGIYRESNTFDSGREEVDPDDAKQEDNPS